MGEKISPNQISIEDILVEEKDQTPINFDHEEFLTKSDFKNEEECPTEEELEKIDGHPLSELDKAGSFEENDKINKNYPENLHTEKKHKEKSHWTSLLEQIPEKDRRYINPQTLIQRTDENGRFRRGFAESTAIARRVLNENGKPVTKGSLIEYTALTEVSFGYEPKDGIKNWIHFMVRPGENFFAPKCGENKEKRKKLLRNK